MILIRISTRYATPNTYHLSVYRDNNYSNKLLLFFTFSKFWEFIKTFKNTKHILQILLFHLSPMKKKYYCASDVSIDQHCCELIHIHLNLVYPVLIHPELRFIRNGFNRNILIVLYLKTPSVRNCNNATLMYCGCCG